MSKAKMATTALAFVTGSALAVSSASATVIFDGTSDYLFGQGGIASGPPQNKFVLENNGTSVLDPNLFSVFGSDAAGSIGDGTDNVVALPGEDTLRITAKLTPEDSGLAGRTLILQLSEFNADVDNGVDPIADRHENFNYAIDPNSFVQGVFTSIQIPVSAAVFVFSSFPDGSGFNVNPINGVLDSSTLGISQIAPQDPTSDGATSDNPLGGTIGIEIRSIKLVPEPASLALIGLGGLGLLRRRA